MNPSKSSSQLLTLYKELYRHFGPQQWWPADTAWEMMVGAILTQNTAWTNVEKALTSLKQHRALSIPKIAAMPLPRLEKLIRSSGFFRQKARRLRGFARVLVRDRAFRNALAGRPRGHWPELRRRLLAIAGIGPETADSILLYAGHYPVFVIDAYTRRIGQRIGFFQSDNYHDVQAYFMNALPKKVGLYNEFHAQLVMLAKHFCTRRRPSCEQCPVSMHCLYAEKTKSL